MATPKTVNDLPTEVLLLIFEPLSYNDLLQARRVSRDWRNVIDAGSKLIGQTLFLSPQPVTKWRDGAAVVKLHPTLPVVRWSDECADGFMATIDLRAVLASDRTPWREALISQSLVKKVQFERDWAHRNARTLARSTWLEKQVIDAPTGVTFAHVVDTIKEGLDRVKQRVAAQEGIALDKMEEMFEGDDGLQLLWEHEGMDALKIKCLNACYVRG